MAQISLGIGSSHSPMLSTPHEAFGGHADRDRARVPAFARLARDKAAWIDRELRPEVTRARHEATQSALARLGRVMAEAAPEVLVVIGDDQAEWFSADSQPALCIYWGDVVENLPPPVEHMAPSLRQAYWGYYGDGSNRAYPVDAALGRYLVETLTHEHEFDVAHVRVQPRHAPLGHAWSFVHQRLMGERIVPIVPVLLNTYFPPNQPTPRRCYQLGRAIRQAVEAWAEPRRVGIVASGGLSHFVVDEALDRRVLDALARRDAAALTALPGAQLDSGNSEIRNWIAAAGAVEHLSMTLVDYVPSYRSEAGTGVGMAFAVWD
ncbi:MAG TPA: extradiol ring-cleavage dioxygenase [Candidatus Binatia bacterium]|nr:extradiol ring-cleavage dioxygenase [Candidatus Binatia bacterium]